MSRGSLAWTLAALSLAPAAALAEAPPPPTEDLPVTYRGTSVTMGGPGRSQTFRIEITIERWSSVEERRGFLEALKAGGQNAVLEAMKPVEVGYVQVNDSPRYRLRTAAFADTEKGRTIRVVTDRPIRFTESMNAVRSPDYPFGFIEFTLPEDGEAGEGAVIFAAQVEFDEAGNLSVRTLPGTTGAQRLLGVERRKSKKKKKSKG
jgi:hypothetical protein